LSFHPISVTVILCQNPEGASTAAVGSNLVVVEGGPKGIRKFIKLMTQRYQIYQTL
jgi:hypothetical protein